MSPYKKSTIVLSLLASVLLLFSFVSNDEKREYSNIEIQHYFREHLVIIDYSNGEREQRAYTCAGNIRKKVLEKNGFKVHLVETLSPENKMTMELLTEFSDLGWTLNSHSKTATNWSDETTTSTSETTNLILER